MSSRNYMYLLLLAVLVPAVMIGTAAAQEDVFLPLVPGDGGIRAHDPMVLAARVEKVSVCHVDGQGNFRLIKIAESALQAHLDHGDREIGDPVPGVVWSVFDENCLPHRLEIAFQSNRDGNSEIYVMDTDGTRQTNLTNNAASDAQPAWSQDGTQMAFLSNRDNNEDIWIMNEDGTVARLTFHPARDMSPTWSPDGSQIAFASNRDGNWEIYVMAVDGSSLSRLTNAADRTDTEPAWSPDGTKIAFQKNCGIMQSSYYDVWTMDTDGSNQTNLTNTCGTSFTTKDSRPAWSPDGTKLAFQSSRDDLPMQQRYEIYVMDAEVGASQVRLTNNGGDNQVPVWSPDGTMIAFESHVDNDWEIYVTDATGSVQENLTDNGSAGEREPEW